MVTSMLVTQTTSRMPRGRSSTAGLHGRLDRRNWPAGHANGSLGFLDFLLSRELRRTLAELPHRVLLFNDRVALLHLALPANTTLRFQTAFAMLVTVTFGKAHLEVEHRRTPLNAGEFQIVRPSVGCGLESLAGADLLVTFSRPLVTPIQEPAFQQSDSRS